MARNDFCIGLTPIRVYELFSEFSTLPRRPGNPKPASDYLVQFGERLGYSVSRDDTQNVIIRKPASPGYEASPSVMLQAHMDMVCEKTPESNHDFDRDPIVILRDGDRIHADGTTLGADNGLGVAFLLAILEDASLQHPELECVFTVDEETDMKGAFTLDYSQIHSRIILNTDAPGVSVGGSGELELEMQLRRAALPVSGQAFFKMEVSGLIGGHTGFNALLERGNAIRIIARILRSFLNLTDLRIVSFEGGSGMSSAFARDASCVFCCPEKDQQALAERFAEWQAAIKKELEVPEPDACIAMTSAPQQELASDDVSTRNLLLLLNLLPDGVCSLNKYFQDTVESCVNTGVIETHADHFFLTTLIRSTVGSKKYDLLSRIEDTCALLGVTCRIGRDLPQWDYRPDSKIAARVRPIYPDVEYTIGQGTVECGIFQQNLPDADIIGLGAHFYNAHSPNEYMSVSDIEIHYARLLEVLAALKG